MSAADGVAATMAVIAGVRSTTRGRGFAFATDCDRLHLRTPPKKGVKRPSKTGAACPSGGLPG